MRGLSGRTLGQYQIHERISRGGMSAVYRATQISIGRTVAIKILSAHFLDDRTFLDRFLYEVKIIAHLQHPKILPIHDFGEHDGMPYIVMAYLDGGTLDELCKKGPLPLSKVTHIVNQIAEALDYAHAQGIIHRDFKPSNVLLDRHGNTYLSDFGIAKVEEAELEHSGSTIVGTPAFMAPEAFDTGGQTKAVDIYALGVATFQMLSGRQPYTSTSLIQLINAHAYQPVPDVRALKPELPVGVPMVIERAMAKTPEGRFPTAGALAAALTQAAGDVRPAAPALPDSGTDRFPMTDKTPVIGRSEPAYPRVRFRKLRNFFSKVVFFVGLIFSIAVILIAGIYAQLVLEIGQGLTIVAMREAAQQFGALVQGLINQLLFS